MADKWHPCEVCGSEERKPYLAIARGGVFILADDGPDDDGNESIGVWFDRSFDSDDDCEVCGNTPDRPPSIYLCFDCVPQWLELTALSIPSRVKEGE